MPIIFRHLVDFPWKFVQLSAIKIRSSPKKKIEKERILNTALRRILPSTEGRFIVNGRKTLNI